MSKLDKVDEVFVDALLEVTKKSIIGDSYGSERIITEDGTERSEFG